LSPVAVIVIVGVIIWVVDCFLAEAWLEKHVKNVELRMSILTPLLGMIWWLVVIFKFMARDHPREICAKLDRFTEERN
jgi:hypothetical protein